MNVTDEVLMIMRLLMVDNTGKRLCLRLRGAAYAARRIARGHPDLLPVPAISLRQQMAAGVLSLKHPPADSFFILSKLAN